MLRRRVLKNKDGTVQIRPTFISDYPEGSDGYCIFTEKRPSLTPLNIDLTDNLDCLENWL